MSLLWLQRRVQLTHKSWLAHRVFAVLSDNVVLMRSLSRLGKASHCFFGRPISAEVVLVAWWKLAGARRAHRFMARRGLLSRLRSWRRWAQVRRCRGSLRVVQRRIGKCFGRMYFRRWVAFARQSRIHRSLAATIQGRRYFSLLHGAWQLWVLDWKRTLRQECAKLELQAEEARAGREFIKDELNAMRNECSGDELFRLGIVDELQHSAAEVALLTVDLEEVQSVTRSLEEATAREHEVVEERRAEVSAQNVQRAEHRALLEVQLHQALAAPAVLRTELYQCEEQMEVAVAAEAKAKHTAAQLQKELENLHLAAPRRLQERSDEVARLQENVWRARHMVGSLEAELSRQRLALQARDSVLEAVRITSKDRERMLRTPPPKQRVPEQYDISTATP